MEEFDLLLKKQQLLLGEGKLPESKVFPFGTKGAVMGREKESHVSIGGGKGHARGAIHFQKGRKETTGPTTWSAIRRENFVLGGKKEERR